MGWVAGVSIQTDGPRWLRRSILPYTLALWRVRQLDQAGRRVPLDVGELLRCDLPDWAAIHRSKVLDLQLTPAIGVFVPVMLVGHAAAQKSGHPWATWVSIALMYPLGLLVAALAVRQSWYRDWARWLRPMFLRLGRCPTCAYDLTDVSKEADGLVRCPECAGRWELATAADGLKDLGFQKDLLQQQLAGRRKWWFVGGAAGALIALPLAIVLVRQLGWNPLVPFLGLIVLLLVPLAFVGLRRPTDAR